MKCGRYRNVCQCYCYVSGEWVGWGGVLGVETFRCVLPPLQTPLRGAQSGKLQLEKPPLSASCRAQLQSVSLGLLAGLLLLLLPARVQNGIKLTAIGASDGPGCARQ